MQIEQHGATVFLVDDDFAVRDALTLFIETEGLDIKSYNSAEDYLNDYNPDQPGCLVLDYYLSSMDGLQLQQELARRHIDIPIIFISANANIPVSSKAFRAGAIDFLEKPFDNRLLIHRIQEAIEKDLANRDQRTLESEILQRCEGLTEREKQVMELVVTNYSNKQAAKVLGISNRTVDVHRAHVMEKMQAKSLADLTNMARVCKIKSSRLENT